MPGQTNAVLRPRREFRVRRLRGGGRGGIDNKALALDKMLCLDHDPQYAGMAVSGELKAHPGGCQSDQSQRDPQ